MPKRVDHAERRRLIAEAVFTVISGRGYDAVSLRDVAAAAGVSMGSVQHYFRTKNDMLLFALGYTRDRVFARFAAEAPGLTALESGPAGSRREAILIGARMMLPLDEPGRQEACVNVAFFAAATVTPALAELLREQYERMLGFSKAQLRAAAEAGELVAGLDLDRTATGLFFLVQGLAAPLLIGTFTPDEALAIIEAQLDLIFKPAAGGDTPNGVFGGSP